MNISKLLKTLLFVSHSVLHSVIRMFTLHQQTSFTITPLVAHSSSELSILLLGFQAIRCKVLSKLNESCRRLDIETYDTDGNGLITSPMSYQLIATGQINRVRNGPTLTHNELILTFRFHAMAQSLNKME